MKTTHFSLQPGSEHSRPQHYAPTFIDVFAGCGGLSLGLKRAGWRGLFAIEKDRFAFETLSENFMKRGARYTYTWPEWLDQQPHDVHELLVKYSSRLRSLRGQVDLLAGGPPCQGFSSAGRRDPADPRNKLFRQYLALVELIKPRILLIENVVGITYDFNAQKHRSGGTVRNFAEKLKKELDDDYYVFSDILQASRFGIPQSRSRFFLVAFLRNETDPRLAETFFNQVEHTRNDFLAKRNIPPLVTAKAALSDLEIGRNGIVPCNDSPGYDAIGYSGPRTSFQRAMRDDFSGPPSNTRLAKHRPDIQRRFSKIISLCKSSGRLNVKLSPEMRERFGLRKLSTSVLDPNRPSQTITSMPDDLLHYDEPRTLTVRENARLQTFPDWFVFKGKYTSGGQSRRKEVPRFTQVANAVPPLLAEHLGEVLRTVAFKALTKKHGRAA